ncbi:hypothetical protein GQ53DRAFT_868197 [Thozetella sp. PMI_491]|nr:hypothetical protein GQ53DRAFT_868197 [Thozetella sp. PMI_491]
MDMFPREALLPLPSSTSTSTPDSAGKTPDMTTTKSRTEHASGERLTQQLPAPPSLAACLACREKHLKCDGCSPCSRCIVSYSECVYVASRRGYKGPRKSPIQSSNVTDTSPSPPSASSAGGDCLPVVPHGPQPTQAVKTQLFGQCIVLSSAPGYQPSTEAIVDRPFEAFYHHFHAGHPFILPREFILRMSREGICNFNVVIAAMRYIGSLYLDDDASSAVFLNEAIRLCYLRTAPADGFLVQALLLLVIGLDGSCEQEKARQLLADCERFALEIHMNERQFATLNGCKHRVLEESWRRTWWELYVCDGMIAGVHQVTKFILFDAPSDDIPPPLFLEDLDDQLFLGDSHEFSSFAYRIAAARNLGKVIRMANDIPEEQSVSRIDAFLTNWAMHLPGSKRDSLDAECQLDEMMFQAHFITYASIIMLHQPLSQLDSSPTRDVTSCAPHNHVLSFDAFNVHTRHILNAAREVSKMVTYAAPALSHTHFFTCVLTLSAIVHLCKWSLCSIEDEEDLRQQIRLNVGALNKLSEVWKAANTASSQIRQVAQGIHREKKARQMDPTFWAGFTREQMINSMNVDANIMNDLESMLGHSSQA